LIQVSFASLACEPKTNKAAGLPKYLAG